MTLPPLLIAAENGDLLFYSGVRRRDACFAAIRTACAAQPRGILKIGDTRAYAQPVALGGRTYYFFMDFDRLCACYGVEAAPRAAEGLFDVSTFSKAYAAPRTLGALTRLFADCYADALEDAGVRFYTRDLPRDVVVNVPPNAYALCLALLIRLAAVGEFIAQNTGDDAGALTAQTQQWLLDAQSVIPQPLQPYIDLSGEVFAESGWILDTASGTVFSAIRASLHHTPFIDTIILLDAQTGRLLHLEMLFYQESDYLILLQDLPDSLEDTDGWRQRVADYYGLMANAFRPDDSLVKQWYSTAEPSELGFVLGDADGNAVTYGFRHGAAPGMAIALGSFGS